MVEVICSSECSNGKNLTQVGTRNKIYSEMNDVLYYWMVKPLPILLGKVLGEPVRGKLGDVLRIMGKGGGK
jgi:hypothetical protein